jgi:hypothetical protein
MINTENETKQEATERIGRELRAERKLNEKKDFIRDYYFTLTGEPMTDEQLLKYIEAFDIASDGYNIMSFILKERIIINKNVQRQSIEEFNITNNIKE